MAHVKQEQMSGSRIVTDDGHNALLEGLLAKAVLFTNRTGEIVAAHCEIDRLQPWVAGVLPQPTRPLPAPLRELIQRVLIGRVPDGAVDVLLPTRKAEAEIYHTTVAPARDGSGAISGAVVSIYDLSAVEEVTSNLAQFVRLANIGTMSAGLAHEIKNAMVAVNTFVDILVNKHQDAELAPIVSREIHRIDHIVGQILRVSSPKQLDFRPVRIHELLEHALAVVQYRINGNQIGVVRQLEADPDVVTGESSELEQAFVNLFYNAIDAMGGQGTLTVASRLIYLPEGAPAAEGTPFVRLTLSDTGIGIPAENLDHLFDAFYTTKPSGNGLGLAVTKRIVFDHRGTIGVSSQPGHGTTFTLDFPSAARQP